MEHLPERIALVYDRVNKWGGAEKVLLALHNIFPQAPLYTSVYSPENAAWAKVFPRVIPSFLNHIPLLRNHHELFPFLSPIAFETLKLNQYQAVISVTSAEAKGIITSPEVFHLCYCLTPTRYLYSHAAEYSNLLGPIGKQLSQPMFDYLKSWDQIAKHRPDAYVAISKTVQSRIKNYYGFDSQVVYPPVDISNFKLQTSNSADYYLWVGRFVSYKHPELVVRAFNQTGQPLIMVGASRFNWGQPSLTSKLRLLAKSNINILTNVSDQQLSDLYSHCLGLIYFHEEDFGIVPVEAMSYGKPVLGIDRGGVSETVINGVTGLLSSDDSLSGLITALQNFDTGSYNPQTIRKQAEKFSDERFGREFVKVFTQAWHKHKITYTS